MLIELNMLDMGGLPINIDILLFGNDNLSVEINTFIFSCDVNIVYFYMYVYSFLGRTWGID